MAKMKNGATPSHCVGSRMARARPAARTLSVGRAGR